MVKVKNNLGGYKTIVTVAKKLGGPKHFIVVMLVAGAGIGKICEIGAKNCKRMMKRPKNTAYDFKGEIYVANAFCKNDEKLFFEKGDQIRILEMDKNMVLIEKIGDENNPYVVSTDFIKTNFDCNHEEDVK